MTRHRADVAGRRVSWLQAGHGRPLVLLHAFPLNAEMWRPQLEAVPHGWMLIAPDLPGFGPSAGSFGAGSADPDGLGVGAAGAARGEAQGRVPAGSVDDHAEAVLALLRHLDIEQAAIGGLSMGGYVTFALHRKAPQRFGAMVLADTRADADTAEVKAGREQMQAAVRARGAAAAAEAMVPKLLGPHAADPALAAPVRDIILRNDPQGMIDAIEVLKTRPDSTPLLAQITCPTLVVVGDQDEVTPLALAESMASQIPQASLVVIPQAPHLSNLVQPQAFTRALWDFLAAV